MSYIGQRPVVGRYIKLDQISSGFNGSNTGFSMTAGSQAVFPGTARNLLLSLGGVIQEPDTDFTISGSTLTFTTPPVANTTFFGVIYGDMQATGTPSDGTVLPASIASSGNFSFPEVTVTGDVNIADSIIHSGDTDTKIRFPVANQISFETQGSEAVRIDESGRVGIGIDNPSQLLQVKGNAPIIRIEENQSGGSKRLDLGVTNSGAVGYIGANQSASSLAFQTTNNERMRITSTGLVGIGTTSPSSELEVVDTSGSSIIRASGDSSGTTVTAQLLGSSSGYGIVGTTTNHALAVFTNNSERMRIDSSGNVGIGTTSPNSFSNYKTLTIRGGTSGAGIDLELSSGDIHGRFFGDTNGVQIQSAQAGDSIRFETAGANERMRIDSSGNVGIGTTSPGGFNPHAQELVVRDANGTCGITISTPNNTTGRLAFADPEDDNIGEVRYTHSANTMEFTVNAAERMRIDSSGNVGIGTTSPSDELTIRGSQFQTSQISIGDNGDRFRIGYVHSDGLASSTTASQIVSTSGSDLYIAPASNAASEIHFFSNASSGAPTERMRIDSSGNIGIGTTSPSQRLHIVGASSADSYFRTDTTVNGGLLIYVDGTQRGVFANDSAFSGTKTDIGIGAKGNMIFRVGTSGYTERMRINTSGHVGIGTTSPTAPLHVVNSASSTDAIISNSGNDSRLHIIAGTNQKNSILRFGDPDDDNRGAIDYDHNGDSLAFRIAGVADRLIFNSQGYAAFNATVPNGNAFLMDNNSSTNPEGLYLRFSFAAPNTSARHFLKCTDNVGDKAVIDSNGNSRNLNNSYAGFSDISLKENIVDANSQWDDIKNVRVRVFNFKIDNASDKRIGVVAQEIETVCPKLVEEVFDKDSDGNLLETSTKSVKYSVLYMKAIKALQEAQTRIETLETEVAALKAA